MPRAAALVRNGRSWSQSLTGTTLNDGQVHPATQHRLCKQCSDTLNVWGTNLLVFLVANPEARTGGMELNPLWLCAAATLCACGTVTATMLKG